MGSKAVSDDRLPTFSKFFSGFRASNDPFSVEVRFCLKNVALYLAQCAKYNVEKMSISKKDAAIDSFFLGG